MFQVGTDNRGQYSDIEPDLRHAPLIINESGWVGAWRGDKIRRRLRARQFSEQQERDDTSGGTFDIYQEIFDLKSCIGEKVNSEPGFERNIHAHAMKRGHRRANDTSHSFTPI